MAKAAQPALFEDGELAEAPTPLMTQAVDIYNAVAKRINEAAKGQVWCEAKALTKKRRTALTRAIADYGGTRGFAECLDKASRNAFLLGREGRTGAHRNWKPDLDFFLQEKTVTRLIEGGYPPDYEEGGTKRLVLPTTWKPPQPKPFVQTETLEQRLAASIVSLRKHGFWDRANAAEEKLAALEKRPPVLVPAPDARDPDVVPLRKSPESGVNSRANGGAHGQATDIEGKSASNSAANSPRSAVNRRGPVFDVEPEWTDDIPEGAYENAED